MGKDAHEPNPELREIATEARRHLEWLRDSGVTEIAAEPVRRDPVRPERGDPVSPEREDSVRPERRREAPESKGAPAVATDPVRPESKDSVRPERRREAPESKGAPASNRDSAGPASPAPKGCASPELLTIRQRLGDCSRCKLSGGRTHLVFGVGNPRAELMFVGEGPGADEDAQGEPFVGRAGQLLTKMIEAMGFRREDVYIANVVKCRPPGNRDPEPDEIEACEPFLKAQIEAIRPRVVVALGRFAVQTLLRDATPITRQRGRWREYDAVKLMPTFHPAYLLRNPPEKKKAWEDLQLVMKELGKTAPGK